MLIMKDPKLKLRVFRNMDLLHFTIAYMMDASEDVAENLFIL